MTPLDHAHAAMQAAPEDNAARLGFFECLVGVELFLLLAHAPEGDNVTPMEFPLEDHTCVLVFDTEERLTEFTEKPSAFVAMSGRSIVALLKGQPLGLGVNLSVAPSSILIPPHAIDWLADRLNAPVSEVNVQPETITKPLPIDEKMLASLNGRLATAGGMARMAYLVGVSYKARDARNLLAFIDPVENAKPALKQAISEVLSFSDANDVELDVGFFVSSQTVCAEFAKYGLRFDLPALTATQTTKVMAAPGMDPEKPPIL